MPLPEAPSQYPVDFIESRGALILKEGPDSLVVGLSEKAEQSAMSLIRRLHDKPVEFVRISAVELSIYLGKRLGEIHSSDDIQLVSGEGDRVLLDKLANDAPIVNLVNSVCIDGIRSGASDIHIEASPSGCRVRYRIDGNLRTIRSLDQGRFPAISSRIKIMANLNILERRKPQDGRITVSVGNEHVDFRVSIVPVTGGESIVLRILGRSAIPLSLQQLGFDEKQLARIRSLIKVPHGLILVTGPTGSGKTTTLNSILKEIVNDSIKIVTIEDPVEFIVEGVNQIQINEQINLGFDVILRRVLRQDPNVIMVGEIRDKATAEIALRAALTGHLVLSTLHTNDAASVITRFTDMGIEPYLIASVLRGAIAQRLVRRVCPACVSKDNPDLKEKSIFQKAGITVKKVTRAHGCEECSSTGYKGRIIISELFAADPGLERLILNQARSHEIKSYLQDNGMESIEHYALRLLNDGITTLTEIEREISFTEDTP